MLTERATWHSSCPSTIAMLVVMRPKTRMSLPKTRFCIMISLICPEHSLVSSAIVLPSGRVT